MSCNAQTETPSTTATLQIETINPVTIDKRADPTESEQAMYQACENWRLDPQQIKHFFELSERYPHNPYSEYYQIPCKITGTLKAQGQTWQFTIDGGATGTWQHQQTIKYFGCHQQACSPLVIMPTDKMNPEG